jgi:hypothetical protein
MSSEVHDTFGMTVIGPMFKNILLLCPLWICDRYKKTYLPLKTIQRRFQQGVISNGSVVHRIII